MEDSTVASDKSGGPLPWRMCLLALSVALGRIFITPRLASVPSIEGQFEAFSHIVVGMLLAGWWYNGGRWFARALPGQRERFFGRSSPQTASDLGWLLFAISLWELVWFSAQKLGGV